MAHESFEDPEVAALLNDHYISIKVDKEERPDIDSLYMSFCQAFTGGGGWPMSIFMTCEQKPFFAGTYFPKNKKYGMVGFTELLLAIRERWRKDKQGLLHSAEEMLQSLNPQTPSGKDIESGLLALAAAQFKQNFDPQFGGFGKEPKFPTPHNLLFLMEYYQNSQEPSCLSMAETTLIQMYKGGIFDHIGGGFSRYSTDRYFLVPHFEKMLYDNALLLMSYARMFSITKNPLYRRVAEKIASYIFREMTDSEGGFYSAQDADSDGVEGKYYVFDEEEIFTLLGLREGQRFNDYYDITKEGNFEGKNIPNLLHQEQMGEDLNESLNLLYDYRKTRTRLHLDNKILTSWNSLMIAALAYFHRVTKEDSYLQAAKKANLFIEQKLSQEDILFVSFCNGSASTNGFLDDYAFYIFAQLHLYEATNEAMYFETACRFCHHAIDNFYDFEESGFYLYGKNNETLIVQRKETYDGALPSGNSVMAYNLVKLSLLSEEERFSKLAEEQLRFMAAFANTYPYGYSFYLLALSLYFNPPQHITVVLTKDDDWDKIKDSLPPDAAITRFWEPTEEYPLLNQKTTYYICRDGSCQPASNTI